MSETAGPILNYDRRSLRAALALAILSGALRAAPVGAIAFTAFALADKQIEMPAWIRVCVWLVAVALAVGAFALGFGRFAMLKRSWRSRSLASKARARGIRLRDDELKLAVELARETGGGSQELRQAYLDEVAAGLARCRPSWSYPSRSWLEPVAAAVIVLVPAGLLWAFHPSMPALTGRVLNPFAAVNLDRYVRVWPGDASVPLGSDVEIRLEVLEEEESRPELMVRSATGWSRRTPESEGRERRYTVQNLVEPLSYRIRWKGEWSRKYTVVPVEPVRLSGFSLEIQAPSYTGRPVIRQESPEITGLAGSRVTLRARTNRPIQGATLQISDGREKPATVTDQRTVDVSFDIQKPGSYTFAMAAVEPAASAGVENYPINVTEDRPPEILLLSPTDALIVGEREKIPLTYDVRDDVQVSQVRLEWELGEKTRGETVRRFESRTTGGIFSHSWDLRAAGLRPGDYARYRLVASDANTVTGPGIAATPWMEVAIESFEREHQALEQALESWRDGTVDLLAQVNTIKAKAERSESNLESVAAEFNQSSQLAGRLEEMLRQIVSRMEMDPLADFGVTMEHRAMVESFQTMNNSLVPATRGALNTQNRSAASSQLGAMASELERMSALSEELSKRQNARDVLESGERLERLGEELAAELSSKSAGDPALAAKLNEVMDEARKNLEELARSLQKMPNELPEDFVNQQALKNVDLTKAQDILSSIADAARRGDMKAALAMAQQFLAMTRQMRESLSEAHESFAQANSMSALEQKIAEQQERVAKLAEDQRAAIARTQKLETARLERRLKSQKQAFEKLATRQRAAVNKARETATAAAPTPFRAPLMSQLQPMEEVAAEFDARRVDKSFDQLNSIVNQLQLVETEVLKSTSTASLASAIKEVREEEAAILEELKKLRDQKTDALSSEKPEYSELQQQQEDMARRAGEVRQQLQALSRQTASLGLPLTQPLSKASQEMKAAGGSLSESNSASALSHEEAALASLLEAQEGLSNAQSAMGEMSQRQGPGGGGGPRVIAKPAPGGQRGAGTGRVRLPTAEDYRPPREFREDLLESLKENYPKIYEDIIHRYYRRLAE